VNDVLVRASDLIGRPVVTLGGDRIGEVKDVVLGLQAGVLVGFTLRNPGFLGGPRREALPWSSVHAVGADAVMVGGEDALAGSGGHGEVHPATDVPVITEAGDKLGNVVDVILETGTPAQIVGFEVAAADSMPSKGRRMLLPIEAMRAASAQAVVVPVEATHLVADDLSGFGAAVEQFRSSMQGESS
jgi:sporulation protein YlmC with PRC-barrel domain